MANGLLTASVALSRVPRPNPHVDVTKACGLGGPPSAPVTAAPSSPSARPLGCADGGGARAHANPCVRPKGPRALVTSSLSHK